MLTTKASVWSSRWRTTAQPMKPAPPVTNTTASRNRMDQRLVAPGLLRRPAAPGDESRVLESGIFLSVAQRRSIEAEHAAPGGVQDGMAGGRVPFHGGGEARIDIGVAAGNQAEFQRGAGTLQVGDRRSRQPLLGLRVEMRAAGEGAQAGARNRAGGDGCHGTEGAARLQVCSKRGRARHIDLIEGRRADGAGDRVAGLDERDIDGEILMTGQKLARAVERI